MRMIQKRYIKLIIQVAILGIAIWVLAPQIRELIDNRQTIQNLSLGWLIVGLVVFLSSNIFAALVFQCISTKRLELMKNIQVQLATGFTNRLLPSGIGGVSTNSLFLIRSGYKRPAAVSLALANNLIGFIAFCIVLILSGALAPSSLTKLFTDIPDIFLWITVGLFVAMLATAAYSKKFRRQLTKSLKVSIAVIKSTVSRPIHLCLAILSSSGITLCFVGSLYFCLRSAGIELSPSELMIVFLASAVATSASPTPGGLGAAEVSMLVALEKLSVTGPSALAGVVAFRLITYWLPILPGYLFFRIAGSKRFI